MCVYFHKVKKRKLQLQTGVRLIGYSELPQGANVSVDHCLSLYLSPAMNWQLSTCRPIMLI